MANEFAKNDAPSVMVGVLENIIKSIQGFRMALNKGTELKRADIAEVLVDIEEEVRQSKNIIKTLLRKRDFLEEDKTALEKQLKEKVLTEMNLNTEIAKLQFEIEDLREQNDTLTGAQERYIEYVKEMSTSVSVTKRVDYQQDSFRVEIQPIERVKQVEYTNRLEKELSEEEEPQELPNKAVNEHSPQKETTSEHSERDYYQPENEELGPVLSDESYEKKVLQIKKDKAIIISDLLMEIGADSSLDSYLESKLGSDYINKLTDAECEDEFIGTVIELMEEAKSKVSHRQWMEVERITEEPEEENLVSPIKLKQDDNSLSRSRISNRSDKHFNNFTSNYGRTFDHYSKMGK